MKLSSEHYLQAISEKFSAQKNESNAVKMKSYMRDQFEFFGIKSPARNSLQREVFREYGKPEGGQAVHVVEELWVLPEREYQYFALDILDHALKKLPSSSIKLIEELILTKSWWDTVDFLAANVAGNYFRIYPESVQSVTNRWMDSDNIWLQRSCLLFQLKYKQKTDLRLLYNFIDKLKESDEFFIRKAIGWVLRQYSKTDPEEVEHYVNTNDLKPLSKKEALKHIERNRNNAN